MISLVEKKIIQGEEIVLLRITNSVGSYVEITNIGASIVRIVVPDKNGKLDNITLCYDEIEEYLSDTFYLGATVGRYANRISRATFTLDDNIYHLDKNDGENSNHGGFSGFNKKIFDYQIHSDAVTFFLRSKDGEGGFPGNLQFSVTYTFSEDNELLIEYSALSDKATPVNFTNHTYFNLSSLKNTIWKHELKVNADYHLEMNDTFLPTGKILPVIDSAFDFREYTPIENNAKSKKDNLKGYNAFFIKLNEHTPLASLKDNLSGRIVDLYTSMSGVQIYTGDFLSEPFIPFGGICLEAQYHPDGVNHKNFETSILSPNIEKKDFIKFHFKI